MQGIAPHLLRLVSSPMPLPTESLLFGEVPCDLTEFNDVVGILPLETRLLQRHLSSDSVFPESLEVSLRGLVASWCPDAHVTTG